MSTTELEEQIDAIRREADSVRQNYVRLREHVANAAHLSQLGKDAEMATLKSELREKLTELQNAEKGLVATTIQELQRRVYGTVGTTPDAVISFRDAQERAASLDSPESAREAMRRATLSRDEGLAQAILGRALDMGWRDIVKGYMAENPPIADAVDDLYKVTSFQNDATERLRASMRYMTS